MVWMLYGATGYTGKLLLEEAIRRGHRPIIAGRSEAKLKALAQAHNVDYKAFGVEAAAQAVREAGVDLVLNAAGPFIHTARPMMEACIGAGAHYLDITGEIPVFETAFALDAAAQAGGVLIMSGVGFDIVPSDCLCKYVAEKLPDAVRLEVVIAALSGGSEMGATAGTLKSMLEIMPTGGRVRRGGALLPYDLGAGGQMFRFAEGERRAIPIPWGDVVTAYHSTGIPNITAYMTFPPAMIGMIERFGVLTMTLLRIAPVRAWLAGQIERHVPGPSAAHRESARAQVVARATNAAGESAEAWLDTLEGYQLTMKSGILAVERALAGAYRGTLTPSLAFGADFVLEIDSTRRLDAL